MELYNKILSDMQKSLKGDAAQRDVLKVIVGEFQRQTKPIASDSDVVKILKKFRNNELETLKLQGLPGSLFLTIVESYLPAEATEEEIAAWVEANIDFGKYKSKMQAMGDILKHFGSRADGNMVKGILSRL